MHNMLLAHMLLKPLCFAVKRAQSDCSTSEKSTSSMVSVWIMLNPDCLLELLDLTDS